MAKIVWKKSPKSAYEWIEVEGGESMSHAELMAFRDEYISEHGLMPVETDFVGEKPIHKYGRYLPSSVVAAQALAPTAIPTAEMDAAKLNDKVRYLEAELAKANEALGKQPEKAKAKVVDDVEPGIGSSGRQDTQDARMTLNQQDGVDIVPTGEEVREDMTTDDRSDDNPVRRPGRPRKAD